MRYRLYECGVCKQKFITDNQARWTPNWCGKGCSMVDAEEYYTRMMGKPKFIKEAETLDALAHND